MKTILAFGGLAPHTFKHPILTPLLELVVFGVIALFIFGVIQSVRRNVYRAILTGIILITMYGVYRWIKLGHGNFLIHH